MSKKPVKLSKEEAYDTIINPLMAQIITACKEHKVNAAAWFSLDDELGYRTVLIPDEADQYGLETVKKLQKIMVGPPTFVASIITVVTPK
jgi:hypothetical protein